MKWLGLEINPQKKIVDILKTFPGIGLKTSWQICQRFEINPFLPWIDITSKQQLMVSNYIESTFGGKKSVKLQRKNFLTKYSQNRSLRGWRWKHGLPVHGQRTHSNARTSRRRMV